MTVTINPAPTITRAGLFNGRPFFELSPLIGDDFTVRFSRGYAIEGYDVSEIPIANKPIADYVENKIPFLRVLSSALNTIFAPRFEHGGQTHYSIFGIRVPYSTLGNNPETEYVYWIVKFTPGGLSISAATKGKSYSYFKTQVRLAANAYYDSKRSSQTNILLPDNITEISINNYRLHNNFPDTFGLVFNVRRLTTGQYEIYFSAAAGNVYSDTIRSHSHILSINLLDNTKTRSHSSISLGNKNHFATGSGQQFSSIKFPRTIQSENPFRNKAISFSVDVNTIAAPNSRVEITIFIVFIGDNIRITDIFWDTDYLSKITELRNLWDEFHEEAVNENIALSTQNVGSPNLEGISNPNKSDTKYGEFFIGAASSPNPQLLEFPAPRFYEENRVGGSNTFSGGFAPHAEGNNKTGHRMSFQPKNPQNAPQMFLPAQILGDYFLRQDTPYFVRYINVKKTQSDTFDNIVWNAKGFNYRTAEAGGLIVVHEENNQGTYGNVIRAYTLYYDHQISGNASQKVTVFVDTTLNSNQIIYVIYDIRNDNIAAVLMALAAYHNANVPETSGTITLPEITEDIILPPAEDITVENTETEGGPTSLLPVSIKTLTETHVTFHIGKAPENLDILHRTLFFLRTAAPRGRARSLIQSKLIHNGVEEITMPLSIFLQGLYKIYQRGYDVRGNYVENSPVNWRKGESVTVFTNDFSDESQGTPLNPAEISDIFDKSLIENIPILAGKCKQGVELERESVSF